MAGKERSPNSPSIDLGNAIDLVRALYAKEGRGSVPTEVAFKAMGHKSASGTAKSHLGAVRAYGLVEGTKGNVKISERGLVLMVMPSSAPEYIAALRDTALEPAIFRDLFESKAEGSDEALRHYLIFNRKFLEDAANRLIRVYRASLTLAGMDKSGYTSAMVTPEVKKPPGKEKLGFPDRFVDRETGKVSEYLVQVPLAKGIQAHVSIEAYGSNAIIRPIHVQRLAEYLQLAKHALEADDDEPANDEEAPE